METDHVLCGNLATLLGKVDAVSSRFRILHSVFAAIHIHSQS